MEIRQLWNIVRRWWWLIALPLLIVGVYSLVTYRAPAPSYAMVLRYTAGQSEPLTTSPQFDPTYYRWLASEYIVNGLKAWVRTGAFAQAVSAELAARGVSMSAGEVAGAIVASDNARSILQVFLSGADPERLRLLAEALTTVLQAQNAAVFPQLGGQPAQVILLDEPSVSATPPSLRAQLDLPLRLALALAVGAALALAAHYLDPFVRERDELEKLGVRVIAQIPKHVKRRL